MTDLSKPDLSKDTTGPFVTLGGEPVEFLGRMIGDTWAFRLPDGDLFDVDRTGKRPSSKASSLDIFLAPKEPKTVFVNWYRDGSTGASYESAERARNYLFGDGFTIQLEVDDQGVPIDGSTVRRVDQ